MSLAWDHPHTLSTVREKMFKALSSMGERAHMRHRQSLPARSMSGEKKGTHETDIKKRRAHMRHRQ